jgi:alpha-galactosidase
MHITKQSGLIALALLSLAAADGQAQETKNIGATPQMGWNSWNKFACNIDEKLIRETADALVSSGLRDAGYVYVNLDDCWHGTRDESGNIRPDPQRFPSGIKALADYVHSRGLKLGIYSDAGATTCGGRPGSRGHEYQDARTYAAWGVDYIKYDWCDTEGLSARGAYTTMRDAIRATGRPMLLSICEWGSNKPWEWAKGVGTSWRTTGDITACWDCVVSHGSFTTLGVIPILDSQTGLRVHAGPGHWNDMDMLEVGMGMTEEEDRSHFSLWAMLTSPLILGNDLRSLSESTRKILSNRDVIGINQDPLGIQAWKFRTEGQLEWWAKPMANGEWAVLALNRSNQRVATELDWTRHHISDDFSKRSLDTSNNTYRWRDAWTGKTGDTTGPLKLDLAPHGVTLVRLKTS